MTNFRYQLDPRANASFGIAVLHAIASSPADNVLRRTLVLKGGAALLLVYGSGRATRKDLDFDVVTDDPIDRDPILRLLAGLRDPWNATLAPRPPGDGFEIFDDALNVGPIAYQHRADARYRGQILLQISRRKVPPYLASLIKPHRLQYGPNRTFEFPIASLEVIAAENLFRSVSKKGPVLADFYDLGYILERDFEEVTVGVTFRQICREESFKLAKDKQDAVIRTVADAAKKATTIEALFRDIRVIDPGITPEVARRRVLAGIAYTRTLAGLAPIKGVVRP